MGAHNFVSPPTTGLPSRAFGVFRYLTPDEPHACRETAAVGATPDFMVHPWFTNRRKSLLAILLLAWVGRVVGQGPVLEVELTASGAVRISWSALATGFRLEESPGLDQAAAAWIPVGLEPVEEGGVVSVSIQPVLTARHYRLRSVPGGPTTIVETSPAVGEAGVSVTRETIVRLSGALAADAEISNNQFHATFAGRRILSRVEVGADRRALTLFYLEPLPGGARIRVTLVGDGIRDAGGRDLDADGDGQPGGTATVDFTTTALQGLAGTAVVGRVFASELATTPGGESLRVPLAGVTVTVDGMEETMRAVTDLFGNFRLSPVPAGEFFVHIDGRTALRTVEHPFPEGSFYPFVGKRWHALAGQEVNVDDVYLPLIAEGTLRVVSATAPTMVQFPDSVLARYPDLAGVSLTVPPNALFSDSGIRGGSVGIAPVPPDRLPEPLPPGLDFRLVITVQTDGPLNFDQPVPICFPNLADPVTGQVRPPGTKSALWSFNHDVGEWEVVGPMTVSEDGKLVCTDPGVGIRQPGWHGEQPGNQLTGGNTRNGQPPMASRPRPTGPQECAKDECPCDAACRTGHEVFLHSGEEVLTQLDLMIPGRAGMDFRMERTYRSRMDYNGPLGHGWSFRYNEGLFFEANGDVTRFTGRSHGGTWTLNPDGTYTAPPGYFGVLLRMPDGAFLLVESDGFQRLYRAEDGRMYCHADRFGNRMLFDHDARGNLSRVIDVFGREIRFRFQTSGDGVDRLVRVEDFAGRVVRYQYDARGNLVAVTSPAVTGTSTGNDFPEGRTERYTYSSGFAHPELNHNMLTMTAPEEVAAGGSPMLVWTYGTDPGNPMTFDRVLTETEGGVNASGVAAGGTRRFEYEALNTDAPPGQLELARGRVRVTERNGNVREYYGNERQHHLATRELTRGLREGEPPFYETRSFHDEDGLLVRRVYPEGNEERFAYDTTGSRRSRANVVEHRVVPDAVRGGGEDLVVTFEYEPLFNQLRSVTDPRGNATGFQPPLGSATKDRYTRRIFYDYQESDAAVPLAAILGIDLSSVPRGLGDLNGDGRVDQVHGNPVRMESPSVLLRADSNEANRRGSELQPHVIELQWNDHGQVVARIDEEGNVESFLYHLESDPDGDGKPVFSAYTALSAQVRNGYLAAGVVDQRTSPRRDSAAPPPAQLSVNYAYDPVGNIVGVRTPRGIWTSIEVNALNEVVAVFAGADVTKAVSDGHLPPGDRPFRYTTRFHYDANGRRVLTEQENRDGTTPGVGLYVEQRTVHDILGDVIATWSEVDADGGVTTRVRRDPDQFPIEIIEAEGNRMTLERDERNLVMHLTRGAGTPEAAMVRLEYDRNGNLIRRTDAEDNDGDGQPESLRMAYDGFDRLISKTDPMGNRTKVEYDLLPVPVRRRTWGHPAGQPGAAPVLMSEIRHHLDERERVYRVDARLFVPDGQVAQRTPELEDGDGDGWVSAFIELDALSRETFNVEDDGTVRQTLYDGAGRPVMVLDSAGNRTGIEYDPDSLPVRMITREVASDPAVAAEEYESVWVYDQLGRMIRATDSGGHTIYRTYDSLGNLTGQSDAEGVMGPDPLGRVAGLINGPGNTGLQVYDGLNRLVATIRHLRQGGTGAGAVDGSNPFNADGMVTMRYGFDGNSRMVRIEDDNGNVTRFAYDALNRRIRQVHADGTVQTVTWDRDDNMVETVDALGNRMRHVYDVLNRRVRMEVTAVEGTVGTRLQTYEYDGTSREVRSTDDNGDANQRMEVSEWVYDSLGRVIEERQNGRAISTRYSGDGKRLGTILAGGRRIDRTFDILDRAVGQHDGQQLISEHGWMGIGHRPVWRGNGNETLLTHLNAEGNRVTGYDAARRMVGQRVVRGQQVVLDWAYEFNRAGWRTAEIRQDDHGLKDLYQYDSLYRVVQARFDVDGGSGGVGRALESTAYLMDGVGNRRQIQRPGELPGTGSLGVEPSVMNEYVRVGGVARAHSANGNLVDDGTRSFGYDALNRLVSVRRKADQAVVAEYRYDAEGRRRTKVVHDPDAPGMAPHTTRFLYDGWRGCEDQDGAGRTLVTYVGSPEQMDAMVQMRRTALHPLGPGDFYFHQNIRYDVVAVTDAAGVVVERRVYDDYGRAYGGDKNPVVGSAVGNPFGFQGARLDAETGFYYFRNRYYDPETGRFLQRDPMTDPGNLGNSYTFAWNSPASVMDPMGWCGALLKSTSSGFDLVYGAVDAAVDTYGRAGTVAGSSDAAEGGLAAAKIISNTAGVAASVNSLQASRDLARAVARDQSLQRAAALIQAGRGPQGALSASTHIRMGQAQVQSASQAAKSAKALGEAATVLNGVVVAADTYRQQQNIVESNRQLQRGTAAAYHRTLDEANALIGIYRQRRDCGKLNQKEFLEKLEMVQSIIKTANEGWEASESGRSLAHLTEVAESGLNSLLDVPPGGTALGKLFGWAAGDTFVVK